MATVYLIRHGRAAASFTDDPDPGLDDLGKVQAAAACETLAAYTPLDLRSSPLLRAVETAQPLRDRLGQPLEIEDRLAEIPSPGMTLAERGPWLRGVMQGRWRDQSAALRAWRQALIDCLLAIRTDTAIFSHFVAINAAVGAAEDDDRVLLFRPGNGSITTFEVGGGRLDLVARGEEADSHVN